MPPSIEMKTMRQSLDRWFESLEITPVIVGEFEDSALLKEFGQHGDGIFAAPSAIVETSGGSIGGVPPNLKRNILVGTTIAGNLRCTMAGKRDWGETEIQ